MNGLKRSRVLITGGAGFIGSHLVERLLKEKVKEIVIFDNFANGPNDNLKELLKDKRVTLWKKADIMDKKSVSSALKGVDFVLHIAALKDKLFLGESLVLFRTNVIGTCNVLEACANEGVKKIIFASSIRVYGYGTNQRMLFKEDSRLEDRTLYGISKIIGEEMCRAFYYKFGLKYLTLRYAFVYGPKLYTRKYRNYALISKTIDRIKSGQPPIIYGNGLQTFDCIYIDDAIEATMLALKSDKYNCIYNVGTGVPMSVKKICKIVTELAGCGLKPEYGKKDETFEAYRVENPEKIYRDLGFRHRIELKKGLKKVIKWLEVQ